MQRVKEITEWWKRVKKWKVKKYECSNCAGSVIAGNIEIGGIDQITKIAVGL